MAAEAYVEFIFITKDNHGIGWKVRHFLFSFQTFGRDTAIFLATLK